jgi:hypothetical protein
MRAAGYYTINGVDILKAEQYCDTDWSRNYCLGVAWLIRDLKVRRLDMRSSWHFLALILVAYQ